MQHHAAHRFIPGHHFVIYIYIYLLAFHQAFSAMSSVQCSEVQKVQGLFLGGLEMGTFFSVFGISLRGGELLAARYLQRPHEFGTFRWHHFIGLYGQTSTGASWAPFHVATHIWEAMGHVAFGFWMCCCLMVAWWWSWCMEILISFTTEVRVELFQDVSLNFWMININNYIIYIYDNIRYQSLYTAIRVS